MLSQEDHEGRDEEVCRQAFELGKLHGAVYAAQSHLRLALSVVRCGAANESIAYLHGALECLHRAIPPDPGHCPRCGALPFLESPEPGCWACGLVTRECGCSDETPITDLCPACADRHDAEEDARQGRSE
mgnify:CR=1 FL=1